MILDIFKEDNKIKREIKVAFKKGIFLHQIDKIIKEYIANTDISNLEIIEIIHDYDEYYTNPNYLKKRNQKFWKKLILKKLKLI